MVDSSHGFFLFPSRRELLLALFEGGGTFSSAMIIAWFKKGILTFDGYKYCRFISECDSDFEESESGLVKLYDCDSSDILEK